jgi:hypothetical protein
MKKSELLDLISEKHLNIETLSNRIAYIEGKNPEAKKEYDRLKHEMDGWVSGFNLSLADLSNKVETTARRVLGLVKNPGRVNKKEFELLSEQVEHLKQVIKLIPTGDQINSQTPSNKALNHLKTDMDGWVSGFNLSLRGLAGKVEEDVRQIHAEMRQFIQREEKERTEVQVQLSKFIHLMTFFSKELKELRDNVDNLYTHNLLEPEPDETLDLGPLTLWQHGETGRMAWSRDPGPGWHEVPTQYEDDLPELSAEDYSNWFDNSMIINGVRMGPKVANPVIPSEGGEPWQV